MAKNIVVMGAGGHGKVIADIVLKSGDKVIGFLDDSLPTDSIIIRDLDIKVIGKFEDCKNYKDNSEFIIAIGNNQVREEISKKYELKYYTAIHPTVTIGADVKIEEGTVVMAGAIINPATCIGKHCIINTSSVVEHDNEISDFAHISPNATLCGTVKVGKSSHIGAGAVIKNNVTITDNVVVGAGTVVIENIDGQGTYVGVPARKVK